MCFGSFLSISLNTIITSFVIQSYKVMKDDNCLTMAFARSGNLSAIAPNAYIDFLEIS